MSRPEVRLTYEEYLLFPEDGLRHELIDGEHEVTPAPSRRHQGILWRLTRAVDRWLVSHPEAGRAYFAPFEVKLSAFDVVQPDLVFVAAAHQSRFTDAGLAGAPDLAVEILSPGTNRRDRTLKLRLYEKFGVAEYWLIDPDTESVTVQQLRAGRFEANEPLVGSATLRSALLPGLEIPLASLFDTAD